MAGQITYRNKSGLEAIAAWCDDHVSAVDSVRRLFAPDLQSFKEVVFRTSFREELEPFRARLETPDLIEHLEPESRWDDAKTYMARLVCYVWENVEASNSNTKASDYVFRIAREGSRLYADCRYARALLEKYGKQVSTVRKEAKLLHAKGTHFKKAKWRGVEKPPTRTQMFKASKVEEDRQIRKERRCSWC